MNFELLAERTRYFKETPEGVEEMCKAMEEMVNKRVDEHTDRLVLQTIRNLMESLKLTADEAMKAMKLSDADKVKYKSQL